MIAVFIILLSSIAAISVAIQDRIAHYDNIGLGWWSQDYYHKAKYYFIEKYPKVPKWFVMYFLVMFLDGWHFFKLVSLLCFFGMVALFDWQFALLGFALYQLYFNIFYSE